MFQLIASQAEELKGLKLRLVVVETEAKESKEILERKVASATAKLEKSQIDLVCMIRTAMLAYTSLELHTLVLPSLADSRALLL